MQAILDFVIGRLMVVLEWLVSLPRGGKRLVVLAVDLVLFIQSIWIAYSIRIGEWILWNSAVAKFTIPALCLMLPIFYFSGVYSTIFRYAGTGMLRTLVRAFTLYTAGVALIFLILGVPTVPRTLALAQPMLFFIMVGASRVLARAAIVDLLERSKFGGHVRHILIYGAGKAGQQLAASVRSDPEMIVHGFVDDDQRLAGQRLDGYKVYWARDLPEVIEQTGTTDVLLALPRIGRKQKRKILEDIRKLKINVQTLPEMKDIVGGTVSINDIRPLEIEDLLGREPVAPNELLLGRTIVGKSVLVTGAGGSIGSELCRQIAKIGARRLVLFEISEFALYAIEQELGRTHPDLEIVPMLNSVTDRIALESTFRRYEVDTVFHAAAYKHVPLVEANPIAAIRNNVIGTREVVAAAAACGVADFILISTDKAVRPTNVMGATKRAAEQIVQVYASSGNTTRYSMVRFGNVLGSSGSVVPLFRRQIEAGGPITLTNRKITRYFMTIPEAANLVIQAGGLAKGGEVFVLDMGRPVKIADLARTMVQLSGLTVRDKSRPDGDIEIVETGLRPGEKLYEELLIGAQSERTRHPRILMAKEGHLSSIELRELIEDLHGTDEAQHALTLLRKLVPEFEHRRDNDLPQKSKRSRRPGVA